MKYTLYYLPVSSYKSKNFFFLQVNKLTVNKTINHVFNCISYYTVIKEKVARSLNETCISFEYNHQLTAYTSPAVPTCWYTDKQKKKKKRRNEWWLDRERGGVANTTLELFTGLEGAILTFYIKFQRANINCLR